MQKVLLLLIGAVLVLAGVFLAPRLFSNGEPPVMRWSEADEVAIVHEGADTAQGDPAVAEGAVDRTAVDLSPAASEVSDDRVDAVLRGRVVDKFRQPVAAAKVYLDFGRGGPRGRGGPQNQRRVPDPVTTDGEGRFAFQGQAFRNLRVVLQVAHPQHAVGLFDKDLGAIGAEVDLGDLALTPGGVVLGRVTDLDGNGIGSANVVMQPENGNRLRFVRDREKLVASITSDNNGFFRVDHAAAGEWTVQVTAKRHTEGRSPTFVVEEEQQVELDDIRLGPGYEVTGYVRDSRSQPIAKATVTLRSQNPGRGGRGGPGGQSGQGGPGRGPGGGSPWNFGGGRDHTATTDEQGRFFLEHLPGAAMSLEANAEGYLDYSQENIDPTLGQPIQVAMQDGLRIAGQVLDGTDNTPVTMFSARALRLRGLPVAGMENIDWAQMMTRMRDGSLSEAEQQQLRTQMASMRGQFGNQRRGGPGGGPGQGQDMQQGGPGGGRGGRGGRDNGKPERHADGQFVLTGLQEGVYEVVVTSDDHTRYQSQEIEVRYGAPAPTMTVALDRGVYVAGVVRNEHGAPVANARVELRPSSPDQSGANAPNGGQRGGRGQRGQRGQQGQPGSGGQPDFQGMAQQFTQQMRNFQQTLEERTNAEGEFIFKHATRGTYRVTASAQGFADASSDLLTIDADRSDVSLQLGMLGSIAGVVRGFREGEHAEVRVGAIAIGDNGGGGMAAMFGRGRGNGGPFRTGDVAADGSYRIADLEPGNYLVRSWIGSPQDIMRELGPQLFDGSLQADVQVRGGEVAKLDLTVVRPQLGVVNGTVMLNGEPAKGLQVELSQQGDGSGNGSNQGGRGGRGMMAGFGRNLRATVSSSGRFEIKDVPAGQYTLQVRSEGRRGGPLREEPITVTADATLELHLTVVSTTLSGTLADDGTGTVAELRGNVTLLAGVTQMPEDLGAWRRQDGNTTYDARVQGGKFTFESLPPDTYLLVTTLQGRERTTQSVVVPAGGMTVVVTPGAVRAADPAAGNQPGAGGPGRTNGGPTRGTGGNAPAPRNR